MTQYTSWLYEQRDVQNLFCTGTQLALALRRYYWNSNPGQFKSLLKISGPKSENTNNMVHAWFIRSLFHGTHVPKWLQHYSGCARERSPGSADARQQLAIQQLAKSDHLNRKADECAARRLVESELESA